jgi:hypothetical protein
MELKVGQSLISVVDGTAVLVVKAPAHELAITCGGAEMIDMTKGASPGRENSSAEPGAGAQLGKRYANADGTLELLCTKAGCNELAANGEVLSLKATKSLPASD